MKNLLLTCIVMLACLVTRAEVIEHTYHFSHPLMTEVDGYQIISFEGCRPTGDMGAPMLPWMPVSLVMPQDQDAASIEVVYSDFYELEGSYNLYPVQPERPISADGPFEFIKNETLYQSTEEFPEKTNSAVQTQYLNGVAFAFSGFTPMRYVPATGRVSYARTVTVRIETKGSRVDNSRKLWLREENLKAINKLAQNPEMVSTYSRRDNKMPSYDVLIVAPGSYEDMFNDYISLYAGRGVRIRVATTADIYSTMGGRDNKEKIRNYIIQEYEENGITSVVLAGDVNLVPYRGLWCHAQDGYEDNIPADLYYAGLDGTWNDNGNNKWGEIGEDDLLPEIGVSRLPFKNINTLNTLLAKTTLYITEPVLGEFHKTTLAGEHLGDGYYASSDLERLVGMSDFNGYTTYGYDEDIYEISRVYETPTHSWNANELRDVIRQGTQFVNHFGHANTSYVAGWSNWDINENLFNGANGVDHNFTVFQSQGCICGDFADDCILERMVNNPTGVIASTGNSRYGWYSTAGDASSAHFNRELVDAFYHERIPELTMAFRESKIMTSPYITMYGESGTMRWTMYALNVIGDGTLPVWFDEPFNPTVEYPAVLEVGANTIPVDIHNEEGQALFNFTCRLFNGEDLIGMASTDREGHADLNFYPVLNTDTLTLVITGMSAWPEFYTVTFPEGDCSHVIFDEFQLHDEDGQVDYNEEHILGITFRNVGNLSAENVTATLTADQPDYVRILQGSATVGSMDPFAFVTVDDAFQIKVCDSIIDNTELGFTLSCTNGSEVWTSHFSLIAHAPNFEIGNIILTEIEGNGNGLADPGEIIQLTFAIKNIGGCLAHNTHFGVYCSAPEIMFDVNEFDLEDLAVEEVKNVDFTFSVGDNIARATAFELILAAYAGHYYRGGHCYVNVGCAVEDFETGNFSKYNWQHTAAHQWSIVNSGAFEGEYCAKSPALGNNQMASMWLDYVVLRENEFSFYYKVSSELAYDFLSFYLDNQLVDRWSGEEDWTKATFVLSQGTHKLKWTYAKDAGAESGQDCAWLDFIVFPPDVTVLGMGSEVIDLNTIYPNPNDGHCTLSLTETSDVTIYNTLGQVVMTLHQVDGEQSIAIANSGLYLVQIQNANGTTCQKLIVK